MDLYNWTAIIEASTLYDSAIKKETYFKESLETAKLNFEQKSNEIVKYAVYTLQLGEKIIDLDKINGKPRPVLTHKQAFENKYNSFVEKINEQIKLLYWDIISETEILECELKTTIQEKYFCFSKLKTSYTSFLNDNEFMLKEANPKAYEQHKKEYTGQLEKIENRLFKLKEQNSKPQQSVKSTQDYSLQCDYSKSKIENDLYPLFDMVFECTKEQIENLLSENISTQITAKKGFTLKDIVYFVWWLKDKNHIKSVQYGNVIDKTKCIKWNGKPITSTQIKKTKDTFKTSLPSIEISNILD